MGKFAAFLLIGGVLTVLGITNIKGNISSIHWYNRRKVSERDIPKYGKCVGSGTLVMGVSMILSALFEILGSERSRIGYYLMHIFVGSCAILHTPRRYL